MSIQVSQAAFTDSARFARGFLRFVLLQPRNRCFNQRAVLLEAEKHSLHERKQFLRLARIDGDFLHFHDAGFLCLDQLPCLCNVMVCEGKRLPLRFDAAHFILRWTRYPTVRVAEVPGK